MWQHEIDDDDDEKLIAAHKTIDTFLDAAARHEVTANLLDIHVSKMYERMPLDVQSRVDDFLIQSVERHYDAVRYRIRHTGLYRSVVEHLNELIYFQRTFAQTRPWLTFLFEDLHLYVPFYSYELHLPFYDEP